jgi:hypothetical protein
MSGGHFDYKQYTIQMIADEVDYLIESNGKPYSEEYEYVREYSEETIDQFKKAYLILKLAYVYTHRIDWLVSGDDGEDTFHERLRQDLSQLGIIDLDVKT